MWLHKLRLLSLGEIHIKKLKSIMLQNMQYKMGLKKRTWLFETLRPIGTGLRGEDFLETVFTKWGSLPIKEYECKGNEYILDITWEGPDRISPLVNYLIKSDYNPEYTIKDPDWGDIYRYAPNDYIPENEIHNMTTDALFERKL